MKDIVKVLLGVIWVTSLSLGGTFAQTPQGLNESSLRDAINRHAQVLVREANTIELVQRAERAVFYLQKTGGEVKDLEQLSETLNAATTECRELLQANKELPKVDALDYPKIEASLSKIEKQASDIIEKAVPRFQKIFPWYSEEKARGVTSALLSIGEGTPARERKTEKPSPESKEAFVRSLPVILRIDDFGAQPDRPESAKQLSYYFGKGNWDVFSPLRFDAANPHAWLNQMEAMEVGEGKFDLSALDRLIETNARHGYPTDIDVQFHGFPAWMKDKYGSGIEEMYIADKDGNLDLRGEVQDFYHPEVMNRILACLKALGEHCSDNPNVCMYELTNEPQLKVFGKGPASYSKAAKQAFREFLKNKYSDIKSLNALWGTAYKSFEAVEPPAGVTRVESSEPAGLLYDFARFRCGSFTDFFRRIVTALQEADPNHPVCSQFAGSRFATEIVVPTAEDFFALMDVPWDMFGKHHTNGAAPAVDECVTAGFNLYTHRMLCVDEMVWSWWQGAEEQLKQDDELTARARAERNLWREIAWGKRGFTVFVLDEQWADWDNNLLAFGRGSVAAPEPQLGGGQEAQNPVGDTNLRYPAAAFPVQTQKYRALGNILREAQIEFSLVGVLSTEANLVLSPTPTLEPSQLRLFEELLTHNVVPRLIPERCILDGRENLRDIKILIAPSVLYVSQGLDQTILNWVKQGGTLITFGPFAQFDPYGRRLQSFDQITPTSAEQETTRARNINYGSGQIMIFAQEDFSGFLKGAVDAAGLLKIVDSDAAVRSANISVRTGMEPEETPLSDLELLPLRSSNRELLIAINLNAEKQIKPTVRRKGNYHRVVELTGQGSLPVPYRTKDNWTEMELSLTPGAAVVLEFENTIP